MIRRISQLPELRKLAKQGASRKDLARRFDLSRRDIKCLLDRNYVSHQWLVDVVQLERRIP
jgi:hypothetical protein